MSYSREQKLKMLQACLLLPLSDSELHMMRNLAHHYAMGTDSQWASESMERADAIRLLLLKCQEMLNVSQS